MPTTSNPTTEGRADSSDGVDVKRLRIELSGEVDDRLLCQCDRAQLDHLAAREVLEVCGRHLTSLTNRRRSSRLGVPLFGHATQLRVFVDPDLLQYDEVWAAAGTWNDNFGANPNDIVRVAGGVVTDLKRA